MVTLPNQNPCTGGFSVMSPVRHITCCEKPRPPLWETPDPLRN